MFKNSQIQFGILDTFVYFHRMDFVLLSSLVAFLVTFLSIPVIIRVAELKHLYDLPDDRKHHPFPIPSLGGVGIFAGFILTLLLLWPAGVHAEMQYLVAAFLIVFFLGLKDDIIILTPLKKFIGQMAAAGLLIFKADLLITGLHGFFGIQELPLIWSYVFTFFTFLVIINSFNLIDGVDGLAGSLGILSTSLFGAYFLFTGDAFYSILAFSLSGSLLAFLIYNVSPAKIFMGDTGSLLMGIVNAILVIKFIQQATNAGAVLPLPAAPAIGFAILFVPLFDTLRIFAYRIFNRRSPFSPDRNHVHHILLAKGCSHPVVTALIVLFNMVVILLTYLGRPLGNTILLMVLNAAGFVLIGLLIYTGRNKRQLFSGKSLNQDSIEEPLKVIKIHSGGEESDSKEIAK
jgi:UDP-N-acetylmuramyl pentapeptide phosphotransferase/UDP-N-acetylglucosamine-1-phosphate transferase